MADENLMHRISVYLSEGNKTNRQSSKLGQGLCLIDYSKRKDRDYYYDHLAGPNEHRFDIFPPRLIKHIASPDFKRFSKRPPFIQQPKLPKDHREQQTFQPGNPTYDPKYDYPKRLLSQGVPHFSRMLQRPMFSDKSPMIPDYYD